MIDRDLGNEDVGPAGVVCCVSPSWRARSSEAIGRSAAQVAFVEGGDALAERLARDWSVEAVVLDLGLAVPALAGRFGPGGPRLIAFGETANAGIALAAARVDFVDADADAAVIAALLRAPAPATAGVADLSDRSAARRIAIGAEAERVAAALARLAGTPAPPAVPVTATAVRQVIRARRSRDRFFPADIFGDPAWDMLLDLFAASIEGTAVSVTSLCIAAAVPTSTALRWIRTLCDDGIFDRRADPADARRAFVALTPGSVTAMTAYFAAIDGAVAA